MNGYYSPKPAGVFMGLHNTNLVHLNTFLEFVN